MGDRKRWLVSLVFYDTSLAEPVIAMSRSRAGGYPPAVYGGSVFFGMRDLAAFVAHSASLLGCPVETFGEVPVLHALRMMAPRISVGNGHATMRRTSPDKRWHLVADIFREGSFPDESLS